MPSIQEVIKNLDSDDSRHIVSVSGGKDSAALALYMKEAYPEIPTEYVFCDTGCELKETYDYLACLEALLGKKINYVNAIAASGAKDKPGRNPFEIWLSQYGGFLPNPQARWCTRVLKIEPFEAYVGDDYAYSYIGIRADEDREGYVSRKPPVISQRPNIVAVYPFKDDGMRLADIQQILEDSGVGAPEYYEWRSRSGCYFCFYQQIGEWKRLKEHHPDLFEQAKKYEREENGKKFTWVQGRTLAEIADLPGEYPLPDANDEEGCAICHL
jgi:3'-phosphoadenosine 5'-phosphosulfate sulfotransferase (PAPS reductase)/FAD synthetase